MTALFQNRLSGKTTDFPDKKSFLGQWVCIDSDNCVSLNLNPLHKYDFLIPNASQQWVITDQLENRNGSFSPHNLPDQLESSSIRTIGVELKSLYESEATFSDWIKQSPVVPRISEAIELNSFDLAIEEHICHLELICMKPRAHLWTEIEKVPVSKARRIPIHALNYLASHTEDWERPTLRNIRPKKILSLITDDQRDIYENRVTVRLTDHLNHYLNSRSYELKKAFQLFSKADFSDSTMTGTRHRKDRIFRLWGEHFDETEGYLKAEDTLKKIENLRYRILRLKNSFLYRVIPRQMMVSNTLKMTNIFANDQHYRHVAILWREWSKFGITQIETPAQVYQKFQELCHGFNRFCMLLILRALDQLKFSPHMPDTPITEAKEIRFKDRFGEVILKWEHNGVVTFFKDNKKVLKIIPMPFSPGEHPKTIQQHLDSIAENKPKTGDELTLLLAISGPEDQLQNYAEQIRQYFNNIGNAPSPLSSKKLGILLVSPWEIESVERVARALRWIFTGTDFLNYPPKIRKPLFNTITEIEGNTDWLKMNKGYYHFLHIPRKDKELKIAIEQKRKELSQTQEQMEAEIENSDRNSQKRKNLNHKLSQIKSDSDELDKFEKEFSKSEKYLNALSQCPVCSASENILQSDNDIFSCNCQDCEAQWGLRFCDKCSERFPFLLPSGFNSEITDDCTDRVFGCDILSIRLSGVFICPYCWSETN